MLGLRAAVCILAVTTARLRRAGQETRQAMCRRERAVQSSSSLWDPRVRGHLRRSGRYLRLVLSLPGCRAVHTPKWVGGWELSEGCSSSPELTSVKNVLF